MKNIKATVENVNGEMNIKEFLLNKLSLSATLIKKVKFGGVFINGENVHMRATLKNGDVAEVRFSEEKSEGIEPIKIPLDIIYEDDFLLAVNKPVNMPTHPAKGTNLPTLANATVAYMGENFVFRAVNRLDKNTSGIVVIAKDTLTSSKLSSLIKNHKFTKKYEAVLLGIPEYKTGTINAPIERESPESMKRCVRSDGKTAITEYKLLDIREDGNSLCEFTLHTGRTHQIRVHSSYMGHPLLGDEMYGGGTGTYMLHCKEMTFIHPYTGEKLFLFSKANFNV